MSNGFLSVAERERWQRFPDTIPQDDLAAYFLLSDDDQREINRQREPFNRLGYALQLCMLRYLGFVPTDFKATSPEAVSFVAEQLGIAPRVLSQYDNRRTQSDHRRYVLAASIAPARLTCRTIPDFNRISKAGLTGSGCWIGGTKCYERRAR